jgi:hypothetical protein
MGRAAYLDYFPASYLHDIPTSRHPFLAFTIRYNALYYPAIASIVFLVSRLSWGYKLSAIGFQFLLIILFVIYTSGQMGRLSGVKQFSPFGGWQLANNALYMYGHIYAESPALALGPYRGLDSTVRDYFKATHRVESLLEYNAESPGFFYTASDKSPLQRYMHSQYGPDSTFQDFRKWGPSGNFYSGYGKWLIKTYPWQYARYFIFPNTVRYFIPPTEIFSKYSPYFLRSDEFGAMAKQLFDLHTLMVSVGLINFRTRLLGWYPWFFTLINLLFILNLASYLFVNGFRKCDKVRNYIIGLSVLLWWANLCFSVIASCVVLRYQVFIMIVVFSFFVILADYIFWVKTPEIG